MAKRVWRSRGRISGQTLSYHDRRILDQIAKIIVKNALDSNEFFDSIIKAWKTNEAECNQLKIICREKSKDSSIFLFSHTQKVIAQFPIPNHVLRGPNQLEPYVRTIQNQQANSNVHKYNPSPKIKDLKAGMKRISLDAEVVEIPSSTMVYTRYGNTANVANALISDETGSIRMSLWNHQINLIKKGDHLRITNGKVTKFKGELQVRIGKHGSLDIIPEKKE